PNSEVIITSAPSTDAAGESASCAPSSTNGCARCAVRFHTVTSWDFMTWRANSEPMRPVPKNAIFIALHCAKNCQSRSISRGSSHHHAWSTRAYQVPGDHDEGE